MYCCIFAVKTRTNEEQLQQQPGDISNCAKFSTINESKVHAARPNSLQLIGPLAKYN